MPIEFTMTEMEEEFLMFDREKNNDRILTFPTHRNLHSFALLEHWSATLVNSVTIKLFENSSSR